MITHSSIEALENRIAPAGVVTGNFKDGILSLLGDRADNAVTITGAETPGGFMITVGESDTVLKINGKTGSSLEFEAPLKEVVARMGAGNDTLMFDNLQTLDRVSMSLGSGSNIVTFLDVSVAGSVRYLGGTGDDILQTAGNFFHAGSLGFQGGSGNNVLAIGGQSVTVENAVVYVGGEGSDQASIGGGQTRLGEVQINLGDGGVNSASLGSSSLTVQGGVKITGGNGRDSVEVSSPITVIQGDLQINLGNGGEEGPDAFNLWLGHTRVDGAINVTMGNGTLFAPDSRIFVNTNSIAMVDGTVAGGISIQSGNGDHIFQVSSSGAVTLGPVSVKTGKGNDQFTMMLNSASVGALSVNLGDGDNTFSLESGANNQLLFMPEQTSNPLQVAAITYTGGAGSDSVQISASELKVDGALQLLMGEGANFSSLSTDNLLKSNTFIIRGGSGSDQLGISSALFETTGTLSVNLGAGNNLINISTGTTKVGGTFGLGTKAGDDAISITSSYLLAGAMTINSGDGGDSVMVYTGDTAQIDGQLTLLGGNHPGVQSTTRFTGNSLHLNGGMVASLGDGPNFFQLEGSSLVDSQGELNVNFRGGESDYAVVGSAYQINAGQVNFRGDNGGLTVQLGGTTENLNTAVNLGSVRFNGGDGADSFTMLTRTGVIHGGLGVNLGAGANSLVVNSLEQPSSLLVEGEISVTSKTQGNNFPPKGINVRGFASFDQVTLNNVTSGGPVGIWMGDANSEVALNNCIFPRLGVHLGGGDDYLHLSGGSSMQIRGLARIICAGGNDHITVDSGVTFQAGVIYDGGEGENTLSDMKAIYQPNQPQLINIARNLPA